MAADLSEIFESRIDIDPETNFEKVSIITPSCKGVILFTDSEDSPVVLLTGADIRRTVRAKLFHEEEDAKTRRADLLEIVRSIYFQRCWCDFETDWRHYRAARVVFPDSYKEQIRNYKCFFLKIDQGKKWPVFSATESPGAKGLVYGPFASGKDCKFYEDVLIEAFGLCKNPACLENSDKAPSCPYLQMGLCDGVCVGKISEQEYKNRIYAAIHAIDKPEMIEEELKSKMQDLSKAMKFEQAGSVKNVLTDFSKRLSSFEWVSKVEDFAVLHLDVSEKVKVKGEKKKVQLYAGFFLKAGHIYPLGKFRLEQLEDMVETVSAVKPLSRIAVKASQLKEQFGLIAFHLYRSNRKGVWVDCRGKVDAEIFKENAAEL